MAASDVLKVGIYFYFSCLEVALPEFENFLRIWFLISIGKFLVIIVSFPFLYSLHLECIIISLLYHVLLASMTLSLSLRFFISLSVCNALCVISSAIHTSLLILALFVSSLLFNLPFVFIFYWILHFFVFFSILEFLFVLYKVYMMSIYLQIVLHSYVSHSSFITLNMLFNPIL